MVHVDDLVESRAKQIDAFAHHFNHYRPHEASTAKLVSPFDFSNRPFDSPNFGSKALNQIRRLHG
jgi:hypothetical protein